MENYRPISILPSVSKVFEKIIHKQLFDYFTNNNLFYGNQYGFRSQHSTEMAALELVDRITSAMDKKQACLSIFLDLSKAFDTLDHQILLSKLKYYGVRGPALKLFETYLSDRNQVVQYDNAISDKLTIKTGVPQGSMLGPLLFIIYLNDLIKACTIFKPVIYADDTALCTTLETSVITSDIINSELYTISNWFKLNKLSLNENKTKAMVFCSKQNRSIQIDLSIGGTQIEFVEEFKYLGIILDRHLTWKPHLDQVSKKVAKANGVICRLKNVLPSHILKTIYSSLILPYLTYGIIVWGSVSDRLFKLQKRSVRLISNAKYNAHTDPLFKKLSFLKLSDIYLLQHYKFIYKLEKKILPSYFLSSVFVRNCEMHNYDTRNAADYRTPLGRHSFVMNSIRFRIPNIYSQLPTNIKNKIATHSFSGYTKYIKHFFVDKYQTGCEILNCYICQNISR